MSDGAKSYLEQFASYSDEDLAAQLKQAEKQKNTVIESAISSWTSSKDDLGKMGEIQSVTVERADDDSYTAVVQASFEKRNLTFSLTAEESVSSYGGTSLVPTELSFVVNYSFGEKMEKAALYGKGRYEYLTWYGYRIPGTDLHQFNYQQLQEG